MFLSISTSRPTKLRETGIARFRFLLPLLLFLASTAPTGATPLSVDNVDYASYLFSGIDSSSGGKISGYFKFISASDQNGFNLSASGGFDRDRYFMEAMQLKYDDGRYVNYFLNDSGPEIIGGGIHAATLALHATSIGTGGSNPIPYAGPEHSLTLSADPTFLQLAVAAGPNYITYDELMRVVLAPTIQISGSWSCSARDRYNYDYGKYGSCGGQSIEGSLWSSFEGTLTAVPIPGTVWLLGGALGLLGMVRQLR